MSHRRARILTSAIIIILVITTCARYFYQIPSFLNLQWLSALWFVALIWINIIINYKLLEDWLILENTLFEYPRYRLALAGIGVITALSILDEPFAKLTACFAVASICLWRDHRWSAFLALDMLMMVIIFLILDKQTLANNFAVYLYYFLVIATVTMLVNNKKTSEEGELENI